MKLIINLLCLVMFMPVSYCLARNDIFPTITGSTILSEKRSLRTAVRIPMSILEFKEATTASSSSGFFAANEISVKGDVHKQLIDFPKNTNSKKIYERIISQLNLTGFDLLYQCFSDNCGKKDGFRLYFSTRLNDVNGSQYYVVASRGNIYTAFYVAEIDGQPRGYSLKVTPHSANEVALSNNLIPFDLGSSILNKSSQLIIDEWLLAIPSNTKIVSVIGHADSSGGLSQNKQLAEARAKTVDEYILRKLKGAAIPKVSSLSIANLARPLNGSRGRYVELITHLTE